MKVQPALKSDSRGLNQMASPGHALRPQMGPRPTRAETGDRGLSALDSQLAVRREDAGEREFPPHNPACKDVFKCSKRMPALKPIKCCPAHLLTNLLDIIFLFFSFKYVIYFQREGEGGRKRGRETSV